ncbi:hypothetical protein MKJ04_06455 [Pontibacter sp. E15-1]|uniref:hypothetical protein n=1 Tax=Pontibacter sp. E15-1 TaxID=2919918 RepID=UPI001F4F6483|nr:hypothetical protein [Pontibacter sp. E15-1]MCJ8164481.1 hypothetical protein [Pontibacter sp. E15-1]
MKNRKTYRLVVMVACFLFAGLNLLKIIQGAYTTIDVFLFVTFLLFGGIYAYLLRKDRQG